MRKLTTLLMFLLFSVAQVWAQSRTVTGKVTDEKGGAVEGATVKATSSIKATSTGKDGSFSLSVPANAKQLTISGVGFADRTITIPVSGNVTVSLVSSAGELDEVLVSVPYGQIKRPNVIGSTAQVGTKQITSQSATSITNVLEGQIAGITATNGGGQPGGNVAAIRIRGFGSINASQSPLYVVNGIPYDGDITAISTDDIESVDVLKDAAAASLYGSRAANGVIMISTKKGKKGNYKVGVSLRQGFLNRGIPEYEKLGTKAYYETSWEAKRNSLVYGSGYSMAQANQQASQFLITDLVYNAYNVPNDQLVDNSGKLNPNAKLLWNDSWEKELYRTAQRTNVNLNISGASDRNDFYLSVGYLGEQGTVVNSDYKRYNFRISSNSSPMKWLNTGINMDAAYSINNYSTSGGSASVNPFYFTRYIAPIYPVYQHDLTTGAYVIDPATGKPAYDWGLPSQMGSRPYATNSNPLGALMLDERSSHSVNSNANLFAEVKFLNNFSFKTTLGTTINDDRSKTYQNNTYGDAQAVHGRTTVSNDRVISLTANEVLSWVKSYGKNNFRALAGHENYLLDLSHLDATRTNNKYQGLNDLDNDSTNEGPASSYTDKLRIESYFAGINYDLDGKYLLSASFRTDGSSRFASAYRWGKFYSFGAGWRLSQEKFLSSVKWINDLKLRVSYGEQGNQALGGGLNYYIDRRWYSSDGLGGYVPPSRRNNAKLVWEGNNVANFGLDFSLFNRRLQGTIEYFDRATTNMLFDVDVAASGGATSQYKNAGKLRNYGWELTLGYNVVKAKNFDWRADLNLTTFKNTIVSMPDEFTKNQGFVQGISKLWVGHSIYDFYLKEFAGVDPNTGLGLYYKNVLDNSGKATGQRILTTDVTKADYYYKGSSIPKISGGLTNSFRFKNFECSFLVTFSYGGQFYDGNYAGLMTYGSYGTAWHTDISKRWQKPGDVTNVPRVQANSGLDVGSTRFLFDASYLNIKNFRIGYSIPKNTIKRLKLSDITISCSVDNLALFTAKKGGDPQNSFGGTTDATYPPFRSVNFGVNINF